MIHELGRSIDYGQLAKRCTTLRGALACMSTLLAALPAFCVSSAWADETTSFLAESKRWTGGQTSTS